MDEVTARTVALDQAVKCVSYEDPITPEKVVKTAQAFYEFLVAGNTKAPQK